MLSFYLGAVVRGTVRGTVRVTVRARSLACSCRVFLFFLSFLSCFFGSCQGNARFVLLGAFNYAGLLLVGAMWLLWKMRTARRQVKLCHVTPICRTS